MTKTARLILCNGNSCLGPLAGLEKQRAIYKGTVKTLADASATTLVLVSRKQLVALNEARRTSAELRALGVVNQQLVINGMFQMKCPQDATSQAMQRRSLVALESAKEFIGSLPSFIVPLRPINILGLGGLRVLLDGDGEATCAPRLATEWPPPPLMCFLICGTSNPTKRTTGASPQFISRPWALASRTGNSASTKPLGRIVSIARSSGPATISVWPS